MELPGTVERDFAVGKPLDDVVISRTSGECAGQLWLRQGDGSGNQDKKLQAEEARATNMHVASILRGGYWK